MRTKTLLLTAALGAAGVATSMAQVFSANAVGYINLSLVQGFNLIANQLANPSQSAPNHTLANLIPSPPGGTVVFIFNPGTGLFGQYTFDDVDLIWTPQPQANSVTINLGTGFWALLPSVYTLTLVGEVPQGTLITPTDAAGKFNLISSQVPQSGPVSKPDGTSAPGDGTLALNPSPGDTMFRYSTVTKLFTQYTFDDVDNVWTGPGITPGVNAPSLNVGEGFWLLRNLNTGSYATWTRTFNL